MMNLISLWFRDDSWGPSPDLFRYEVQEIDADDKTPVSNETYVLEAIDVKREKTILTRDKCRVLLKLATDFIEEKGVVLLKVRLWMKMQIPLVWSLSLYYVYVVHLNQIF